MSGRRFAALAVGVAVAMFTLLPSAAADTSPSASKLRLSSTSREAYPGKTVLLSVQGAPSGAKLSLQRLQGSSWRQVMVDTASRWGTTYFSYKVPPDISSLQVRVTAGKVVSNSLRFTVFQSASSFWMNQTNIEPGRLLYSDVASNGVDLSTTILFPFRSDYALRGARGKSALISQRAAGDTAFYTYVPGQQPRYWFTAPNAPSAAMFGRTASELLIIGSTFQPGSAFTDLYAVNAQGQKSEILARFPHPTYQYTGNYPSLWDAAVNPATGEIYLLMTFASTPDRHFVGRLLPERTPVNTSLSALQMLQDQSWVSSFGIVQSIDAEFVSDIQFSPSGRTFAYSKYSNPTSGGSVCYSSALPEVVTTSTCARYNTGDFVYDMALKTDSSAYYVRQDNRGDRLVNEVILSSGTDMGLVARALSVASG